MSYAGADAIHDLPSVLAGHADALDEAAQALHHAVADELVFRGFVAHPWTGQPKITVVLTIIRSGGGVINLARQSTGGNDRLTIKVEVAVSDRLGAERRKSSTETRMYGLAVRPRRRSRNKPAPGTPGRAFLIGSGGGADAGLCQSLRI
jgi:hypothetical protein